VHARPAGRGNSDGIPPYWHQLSQRHLKTLAGSGGPGIWL